MTHIFDISRKLSLETALQLSKLLSETIRGQIIERLEETIDSWRTDERKWVEEERMKGNNPDKAILVMVVRMLISLTRCWQETEKELLVIESQVAKLARTKPRKAS